MLVLTRKANEQIQIGDSVVVTILRIKGQSVQVGIEAPREVLVLRGELPKHDRLPMENEHSSQPAGQQSHAAATGSAPRQTASRAPRRDRSSWSGRTKSDRGFQSPRALTSSTACLTTKSRADAPHDHSAPIFDLDAVRSCETC